MRLSRPEAPRQRLQVPLRLLAGFLSTPKAQRQRDPPMVDFKVNDTKFVLVPGTPKASELRGGKR
jgi:hypothetical protein